MTRSIKLNNKKSTITTKTSKVNVGKSLAQLNKINRQVVEVCSDAATWQEATDIGLSTGTDTTAYRNKLLASMAGRKVVCKGYVIEEAKASNYTIGLVAIYTEEGHLIDTLQHINVYIDILSNFQYLNIGGSTVAGEGNYDVRALSANLVENKTNNAPFTQCEQVEFSGIVYSYRGKWSVGTQRQVDYAATLV